MCVCVCVCACVYVCVHTQACVHVQAQVQASVTAPAECNNVRKIPLSSLSKSTLRNYSRVNMCIFPKTTFFSDQWLSQAAGPPVNGKCAHITTDLWGAVKNNIGVSLHVSKNSQENKTDQLATLIFQSYFRIMTKPEFQN